jgi:pimeloyl-ACP methyl ester carboxylesterase
MIHPSPIPYFYHDLDPTLAEEAARHLGPQARSAMTDTVKHAGWKAFPRTLIQCDDDRAILWDMFALSEQDRAGWEIIKIEGGHSPFLSRPEEVAGVLRRIAGESL